MLNVFKGFFDNYLEVNYFFHYYIIKNKKSILLFLSFALVIGSYKLNVYFQEKDLVKKSSVQYLNYIKNNDLEFLKNKQYGVYKNIQNQINAKKIEKQDLSVYLYCFTDMMSLKKNKLSCLCLYKRHNYNNLVVFSYAKNGYFYETQTSWVKYYQLGYNQEGKIK